MHPRLDRMLPATRRQPMAAAAACLLAACLLAACCPKPPAAKTGPLQVLSSYAEHARAGRADEALALVASQQRKGLSAEALAAFFKAGGAPLGEALAAAAEPDRLPSQWRTRLPDGSTVVLVREADGWRLAAGPLLPGSGGLTPRLALEAFLAAIEAGDCRALAECAPPEVRARHPLKQLQGGCTQQLASLRATAVKLRKAIDGLVQLGPDRAELSYGPQRKLVLVRRGRRWYLQDL